MKESTIGWMPGAIDYATPGPLTHLNRVSPYLLEHISGEPVEMCRPVHNLFIQPDEATNLGMPRARFSENRCQALGHGSPSEHSAQIWRKNCRQRTLEGPNFSFFFRMRTFSSPSHDGDKAAA
jgi:hypothetical protein